MKMDKEWVLKQRFWLLLGTFGLLWFVCLIALAVIGGGPVEAAKKLFDDATTLIKPYTAGSGPSRPKNESFLPEWVKYGKTFSDHKNTVWGIAWYGDKPKPDDPPGKILWAGQGGMYVWPTTECFENGVVVPGDHPLNQLLFNAASPFEVKHRQWYKGTDNYSPYRNQFNVLYYQLRSTADEAKADSPALPQKPLDPTTFKGDFLSGVMRQMDINSEAVTNAPDTEECWLMQEDFWVRGEVLRVVADAMNMAAHMNMDPVGAAADKAADPNVLGQRTFRNDSWEVTLRFDQGGPDQAWRVRPDSTIKNVHVSHRDQELGSPALHNGGVWFRLRLGNAVSKIAFEGTPVPWNQTHSLADGAYKDGWTLKGDPKLSDPNTPVSLEQVFDATNTPVTEIGEIAIPKVSHKNANRLLIAAKPERYGQKPPAPADAKTPGAPALRRACIPGDARLLLRAGRHGRRPQQHGRPHRLRVCRRRPAGHGFRDARGRQPDAELQDRPQPLPLRHGAEPALAAGRYAHRRSVAPARGAGGLRQLAAAFPDDAGGVPARPRRRPGVWIDAARERLPGAGQRLPGAGRRGPADAQRPVPRRDEHRPVVAERPPRREGRVVAERPPFRRDRRDLPGRTQRL